jgi:hypothetical protein
MSGSHSTITLILDDGIRPIDTRIPVGGTLEGLRRTVAGLPSVTLERILHRPPADAYRVNPAPALRAVRAELEARALEAARAYLDRPFATAAEVKTRRRQLTLVPVFTNYTPRGA